VGKFKYCEVDEYGSGKNGAEKEQCKIFLNNKSGLYPYFGGPIQRMHNARRLGAMRKQNLRRQRNLRYLPI